MTETRSTGSAGRTRPSLSIIIPTKNRRDTIRATVESIVAQSIRPDELVVVDQSETDRLSSELGEFVAATGIRLIHLWRPDLTGLAQARNVGFDASAGGIVLFLDDDVALESTYIEQMLRHYRNDGEGRLGGVGGLITNDQVPEPLLYKWFLRGPFADPRARFQAHPTGQSRTTALSGCNMSYRREAYGCARADESLKGYSAGEDWELGQRISRRFELILTSDARLEHRKSPINRQSNLAIMADTIRHQLTFYQKLYTPRERLRPEMLSAHLWYRFGMSAYALARLRRGDAQATRGILKATWLAP